MDDSDHTWQSLHIFHAGDLDRLLVYGLARALDAADAWFFLRYYNGGPHLRVRLRGQAAADTVASAATHWLAANPGPPPDPVAYARITGRMMAATAAGPGRPRGWEVPEPLQPTDTVQRRTYVYDHQRYGTAQRTATEAHFVSSSALALYVVAGTAPGPARSTIALHLLAGVLGALDSPRDVHVAVLRSAATGLSAIRPDFAGFEALGYRSFADARSELGDLVHQITRGIPLPGQSAATNRVLALWEQELRRRWFALRAENGADRPAGTVIGDYLHLLANRLGLGLTQETHLRLLVADAVEGTARTPTMGSSQ